jgi:60 kDa SS-A/Ro ribonucleoprotein
MVNTQLFVTMKGNRLPVPNAVNEAGAPAYALSPKHRLAQYAATGCLNATFYAGAAEQLDTVLRLTKTLDAEFVAKTAVYCRERGYMKDMPSLLAAALTARGPEGQKYLPAVFDRVIDNGKMLRNFVQIVRSGAVGRKSLGSRPKKLVQKWLNTASEKALLSASIGTSPSLADVVKMVHPKPAEAWREAFFAWLIGKPFDEAKLPPITREFVAYVRDRSQPVPDVPFQMLTALELSAEDWARIAKQGSWQMVRMNLNTFARHGVFAIPTVAKQVAAKLRDPEAIAKARAFPYQLLVAYRMASDSVPYKIREALHDALEHSLVNVPALEGKVVVCPDVSGSMSSAVTGSRGSATSQVRCIDVAALVAAALLRKNPDARVLPFENNVVGLKLDARDTVMTNAEKLASIGGGGTNCSAPLAQLNREKARADLVVFVSDNESWIDASRGGATATMREWEVFKQRNPRARLVCIDIQPYATTQAQEREDVLNVGGFSDDVFKILASFASGQMGAGHWVGEVEAVVL